MSRRTLLIAIGVLALFWAAAAVLVQADTQKNNDVAAGLPTLPETIPAPPGREVSLTVFPETVCPGYNLYYTFRLTNTSGITIPSGLAVMAQLPEGTWFDVSNSQHDLGGTIPGEFKEYYNAIQDRTYYWFEWESTDAIAPGERIEARLTLHSYSSLPQGRIITATFHYENFVLGPPPWVAPPPPGISVESRVDRSICQATVTPTPTSTFTPTPIPTEEPTEEPTEYIMVLPLILN